MIRIIKSLVVIFRDAQILKVIESRFNTFMKTNETKEVKKLTLKLIGKAKSVL